MYFFVSHNLTLSIVYVCALSDTLKILFQLMSLWFQGCAARNVHGFMQDDVQKMAGQWEEAPSMYLKLDVKVLSP